MAKIKFNNVGIKAMAACVPQKIAYNSDLTSVMSAEEVDKMINSVGIEQRRICDDDVCASDLCYKAAEKLLTDNNIDRESIDMLIFMSQTSDYRTPATSCILQHKLNLSKKTACVDMTLACSGYVYALSTAFSYASMEGINRILLLDGESYSKVVNVRDKVNVPLYGDAGTATLIEKGDNYGDSTFILYTDGSGEDAVKIPSGGMRNRFTNESIIEKRDSEGNYRSDVEVYMDGMDVFNFALKVVPRGVKEILTEDNITFDNIDYVLFHQSNKFMTDFFIKKLKLSSDKVPYCIQKYGNTSSASVPLTIVSELYDSVDSDKEVVMCGFGAGLSWATARLRLSGCNISPIIEY